jgi:hypothetical protein
MATTTQQRAISGQTVAQWWLGSCIAGFLLLCWLLRRFVADDAYITARYAKNLADGHGFVWNPGGPRVEGFSNPLLVYVEAVGHLFGVPGIDAARALGVACGVALIVAMHRLGPPVLGVWATRIGMALTALYPPMALWAVGGLETLPTALAITTALLLLLRPGADRGSAVKAGLVLAVLPWLRPEGIAIALAIAALAEAPGLLRRAGRRLALVRLGAVAGIPVVSQLVLEAERLIVYGHLVPNSVIYKSGREGIGSEVLEKFYDQATPVVVIAVIGFLLTRRRQWLIAVPPLVYALGSIGTLDSVNTFSRFFMPTWPQLALLCGLAVAAVSQRPRWLRAPVAAAAAVALVLLVVGSQRGDLDNTRGWGERYAACRDGARSAAADWLRANTVAATSFSISDAGLTPAKAGGRSAIDQFQLNDPSIQRTGPLPIADRVDLVLDRDPDVLVITSRTADRYTPLYWMDRRLTMDPRFKRYTLAHVARGRGERCQYHLFLYQKSGRRPELHLASRG